MREETISVVALAHSRECIKELISGLPKFGSMEKFGARAEKTTCPQEKNGGKRASIGFVVGIFFVFCGQCNTGVLYSSKESVALRRTLTGFVSSRYLSPGWDLQYR